jgi:hypothetical protein
MPSVNPDAISLRLRLPMSSLHYRLAAIYGQRKEDEKRAFPSGQELIW